MHSQRLPLQGAEADVISKRRFTSSSIRTFRVVRLINVPLFRAYSIAQSARNIKEMCRPSSSFYGRALRKRLDKPPWNTYNKKRRALLRRPPHRLNRKQLAARVASGRLTRFYGQQPQHKDRNCGIAQDLDDPTLVPHQAPPPPSQTYAGVLTVGNRLYVTASFWPA